MFCDPNVHLRCFGPIFLSKDKDRYDNSYYDLIERTVFTEILTRFIYFVDKSNLLSTVL